MTPKHLLFFLITISQFSIAQYSEVLNFGVNNVGSTLNSTIVDSNGNNIVALRAGSELHVASFDSDNNQNWSKIVHTSSTHFGGKVYASNNGTYYVRTNKHLAKLDNNGNILWAKELQNPWNGYTAGCALPNGGFATLGMITVNSFATVTVFDSNGNVSWSKTIEASTSHSFARTILVTPQGNILTLCDITGLSSILFNVWDINGVMLSQKQFGYNSTEYASSALTSAKITSNGHVYLTGFMGGGFGQFGTNDMVIYHFDQDLNFINGKIFGYTFDDEGRDLVEDDEGNLIAIGMSKPQLNCTGLLKVMKLTPNLDTIYTRHYGNLSKGYLFTEINRTGNVIYASGWGSFGSHFANSDGHLIRTDRNFNLNCGTYQYYTDITDLTLTPTFHTITNLSVEHTFIPYLYEEISSISTHTSCSGIGPIASIDEKKDNQETFTMYPNPASSNLEIKHSGDFNLIQIYTVRGEMILNKSLNDQKTFVDCEDWKPGIYLVHLIGNNGIVTKKLVKD